MPAEPSTPKTLQVEKIACVNNAAFVMNFSVGFAKQKDGGSGKLGESGDYPINQSRTIDLKDKGLQAGDSVWPCVNALAGVSKEGEKIAYAPNGQTATYSVSGTTLIYSINRV